MTKIEKFGEYVGIQGIIAIILVIAYVLFTINGIEVENNFFTLLGMVLGYYFGRNGVGITDVLTSNLLPKKDGE